MRIVSALTAVFILLAGGALWADLVPFVVKPSSGEVLSFEGPPGGPFSPQRFEISVERRPWVQRVRSLVLNGPPKVTTTSANASINGGAGVVTVVQIGLPDDARSKSTGTHPVPVTLRHGVLAYAIGTPEVQLVIKGSPATPLPPPPLTISEDILTFSGPQGGPFTPATSRFTILGRAGGGSWQIAGATPDWLWLSQRSGNVMASPDTIISVSAKPPSSLGPGNYEASVAFKDSADRIYNRTVRLQILRPQPPVQYGAVCDQAAGFKHDSDRVNSNFVVDAGILPDGRLSESLRACSLASGATTELRERRRLQMQNGRLLAEAAVRKAKNGDTSGAMQDMNIAIELWKKAAGNGSAYAKNLLGAYYNGTFNNSAGFKFVNPDSSAALNYWGEASRAGNLVATHNFAVQELRGTGIAQNVDGAITQLEQTSSAGYTLSTFVLGEAYFHGDPPGVPQNPTKGLRMMKSVACIERPALQKLQDLARRGRIADSDVPTC